MGVDFSLYADHDGNTVEVVKKVHSICFACLSSQTTLNSYSESPLTNTIHGIRYYVKNNKTVSIRNAIKWLRAIIYDYGLEKIIPEQTVKSILKDGFYIEGKNVTGPAITGALSLVRCLDEEPDIVNTFVELMDIEGMDAVTAIVFAHGMSTDKWKTNTTHFIVHRSPNNTNHTIYVGKISRDTLKEAWGKVWLDNNNTSVPWIQNRAARGTFVFFSPKGNNYVTKDIFGNKDFSTKEEFVTFLREVIYPLREKYFANKK